jgi:hypothetical protein
LSGEILEVDRQFDIKKIGSLHTCSTTNAVDGTRTKPTAAMTSATPKDPSKVWTGVTLVFALFLTFQALQISSQLVEKQEILASSNDYIDSSRWSQAMLRASRSRIATVMGSDAEKMRTPIKPRQLRLVDSDESSASNRSSQARGQDSSSAGTLQASRSRTSATAMDSNEENSRSSSVSGPSDGYNLDSLQWSEAMIEASRTRIALMDSKSKKRLRGKKKQQQQQQDYLLYTGSSSGSFRPHRKRKCCATRGTAHTNGSVNMLWKQGLDSIARMLRKSKS